MTMRYVLKFYPNSEHEAELALPILAKMKAVIDERAGYQYPASAVEETEPTVVGEGSTVDLRVVKVDGWTHFNDVAPGFGFGTALAALRSGLRVARAGWNGKGMFLYHVPANSYPAQTDAARQQFGDMVPYGAYIAMKTAQDNVVPWLASQTDMLAEDWEIVK